MHQHLAIEERTIHREQAGMVGKAVDALLLLRIFVGGDAHTNVQTHFLFRHLVQGLQIHDAAIRVLARLAPSVLVDHLKQIPPHGMNVLLWQQLLEEQISILIRACPQGFGISQKRGGIYHHALGLFGRIGVYHAQNNSACREIRND